MDKQKNLQQEYNNEIVNDDALYKLLAYSTMIEKQRREDPASYKDNLPGLIGEDRFENYYMRQLMIDAKAPARSFNSADFKPKKAREMPTGDFLNPTERIDVFLEDHQEYQEAKLEDEQRRKAFGVLEQMFTQSKKNSNQKSEDPKLRKVAQELENYFAKGENTEFFDAKQEF
mmetsp:Transcript_14534/g.22569  ORF Transcript_14534/g.22569 Transcript_14534/m.22569 type:complete len:173 (-) Transcript_14534:2-520(-)